MGLGRREIDDAGDHDDDRKQSGRRSGDEKRPQPLRNTQGKQQPKHLLCKSLRSPVGSVSAPVSR
ncbi:phage DNA packaging protein J [uncultured Sphingomonas sp.]|uniref:phage DNA packaging protein J n=1 Tax=uncultured Sphingomonas sp. TaxID=158754 RepID=UPI003441024A